MGETRLHPTRNSTYDGIQSLLQLRREECERFERLLGRRELIRDVEAMKVFVLLL